MTRISLSHFCCLVISVWAYACQQEPVERCAYTYRDRNHREFCAAKWSDVPEHLRSTAKPHALQDDPPINKSRAFWSLGKESEKSGDKPIIKYRTKDGRLAFTNIADEVPVYGKTEAEYIDLTHVSLNTQLGNEINERLTRQYERFVASDYCQKPAPKKEQNWLSTLWSEYRGMVIIAGILLSLLIATPYIVHKINAPDWARVLTTAIPALCFIGLIVFAVSGVAKIQRRSAVLEEINKACAPDAWNRLGSQSNPITARKQMLDNLQKQIEMIEKERGGSQRGLGD